MTKTKTHFTFRVDTWTLDGESIVEHIAGIEDYRVALATFAPPADQRHLVDIDDSFPRDHCAAKPTTE